MPAILLDMFNIVLCHAYFCLCIFLLGAHQRSWSLSTHPGIQRRDQKLIALQTSIEQAIPEHARVCQGRIWPCNGGVAGRMHPGHWNPPAEGLPGMQVIVAAYDSGLRDSNRLLCLSRLQLLDKIDPYWPFHSLWQPLGLVLLLAAALWRVWLSRSL